MGVYVTSVCDECSEEERNPDNRSLPEGWVRAEMDPSMYGRGPSVIVCASCLEGGLPFSHAMLTRKGKERQEIERQEDIEEGEEWKHGNQDTDSD